MNGSGDLSCSASLCQKPGGRQEENCRQCEYFLKVDFHNDPSALHGQAHIFITRHLQSQRPGRNDWPGQFKLHSVDYDRQHRSTIGTATIRGSDSGWRPGTTRADDDAAGDDFGVLVQTQSSATPRPPPSRPGDLTPTSRWFGTRFLWGSFIPCCNADLSRRLHLLTRVARIPLWISQGFVLSRLES